MHRVYAPVDHGIDVSHHGLWRIPSEELAKVQSLGWL
jgi:hypothetical protein